MRTKKKKMVLTANEVEKLNALLRETCQQRSGETLFDREVVFDDGKRVAIQVIAPSSPGDVEGGASAWAQAVLFTPDGHELSNAVDEDSRIDGPWFLYNGDDEYVVVVEKESTTAHFEIVVAVDYEKGSIGDKEELTAALEREVNRVVGDGMLTPSGDEVVERWTVEVNDDE